MVIVPAFEMAALRAAVVSPGDHCRGEGRLVGLEGRWHLDPVAQRAAVPWQPEELSANAVPVTGLGADTLPHAGADPDSAYRVCGDWSGERLQIKQWYASEEALDPWPEVTGELSYPLSTDECQQVLHHLAQVSAVDGSVCEVGSLVDPSGSRHALCIRVQVLTAAWTEFAATHDLAGVYLVPTLVPSHH